MAKNASYEPVSSSDQEDPGIFSNPSEFAGQYSSASQSPVSSEPEGFRKADTVSKNTPQDTSWVGNAKKAEELTKRGRIFKGTSKATEDELGVEAPDLSPLPKNLREGAAMAVGTPWLGAAAPVVARGLGAVWDARNNHINQAGEPVQTPADQNASQPEANMSMPDGTTAYSGGAPVGGGGGGGGGAPAPAAKPVERVNRHEEIEHGMNAAQMTKDTADELREQSDHMGLISAMHDTVIRDAAQKKADHERQAGERAMKHVADWDKMREEARIDPNRLIRNMSTGSKVLAGLGAILGIFGSGSTNPGVEALDKAIKDDVDIQKAQFTQRKEATSHRDSAYADAFRHFQDADQAELAAALDAKKAALSVLQQKMDMTRESGKMDSGAEMAISHLQKSINDGEEKLRDHQATNEMKLQIASMRKGAGKGGGGGGGGMGAGMPAGAGDASAYQGNPDDAALLSSMGEHSRKRISSVSEKMRPVLGQVRIMDDLAKGGGLPDMPTAVRWGTRGEGALSDATRAAYVSGAVGDSNLTPQQRRAKLEQYDKIVPVLQAYRKGVTGVHFAPAEQAEINRLVGAAFDPSLTPADRNAAFTRIWSMVAAQREALMSGLDPMERRALLGSMARERLSSQRQASQLQSKPLQSPNSSPKPANKGAAQ